MREREGIIKGMREFGEGDGYVHQLDSGDDLIFIYIDQNFSNCTFKCVWFIACQLHLNKAIFKKEI